MRHGLLGSFLGLVASGGLALAQPPAPPATAPVLAPAGHPQAVPGGDPSWVADQGPCQPEGAEPITPAGVEVDDGPNAFEEPNQPRPGQNCPDCPHNHVWASFEALTYWIKDAPQPTPLVTTGPFSSLGIIGNPGTSVLLGGRSIDYGTLSGGRAAFGICAPDDSCGLEVTGFLVETGAVTFGASSDAGGTPLLGRPIIDTQTAMETASLVAAPGLASGNVTVDSDSRLWGAEANAHFYYYGPDLMVGFRYLDLDESFRITQRTTLLPGGVSGFNGDIVTAPNGLVLRDEYLARNQFYGGQIGWQKESSWGRMYILMTAKCGLGVNNQTLRTTGTSTLVRPGGPSTTVPAGLLLTRPLLGTFSQQTFAVVPELNLNVGYEVMSGMRVFAGYNLIYMTNALRAAEQPNRTLNSGQVPTSINFDIGVPGIAPRLGFRSNDFWAQGVNFGVAFRY